jgi:hypothetical protein
MAQHSIWKVIFHLETSAGRTTSGPYTTFIGISGGSRSDGQTPATAASVRSAVVANLAGIVGAMGAGAAAPGGTVVVDSFGAASVPDAWE